MKNKHQILKMLDNKDTLSIIIPFLNLKDFLSLLSINKEIYNDGKNIIYNRVSICNLFKIIMKNQNDVINYCNSSLMKYFGNIQINHKQITDKELIRIINHTNQLYKLDINNCENISDKTFNYLDKLSSNNLNGYKKIYLIELKISNCGKINNELFIRNLVDLNTLDISHCVQFTDKILENKNDLRELNISGCKQFSNKAFLPLNNLEILNITYCNQLENKSIEKLTNLHTLYMGHCNSLTTEALLKLKKLKYVDIFACRKINTKLLKNDNCVIYTGHLKIEKARIDINKAVIVY